MNVWVSLRVSRAALERVDEIATKSGRSRSAVLRELLRRGLETVARPT